jgi:hypothetical protein
MIDKNKSLNYSRAADFKNPFPFYPWLLHGGTVLVNKKNSAIFYVSLWVDVINIYNNNNFLKLRLNW